MEVYYSAHLGPELDNSSGPGDFQSTYICVLVIVLYRLYSVLHYIVSPIDLWNPTLLGEDIR